MRRLSHGRKQSAGSVPSNTPETGLSRRTRSPLAPLPGDEGIEFACVRNEPGASATGAIPRLIAFLLAMALLAGCTKYPQVEFANLKYVAALRTACSAKNAEWLSQTKTAIDREHAAGSLSDDEAAAYREIITIAETGDWSAAEEECVRFQKDQLAK